jgi:hypothetical protein
MSKDLGSAELSNIKTEQELSHFFSTHARIGRGEQRVKMVMSNFYRFSFDIEELEDLHSDSAEGLWGELCRKWKEEKIVS